MNPMRSRSLRPETHGGQGALTAGSREPAAETVLGSQVVLDLHDCETDHLDDLEWVKRTLVP